MVHFSKKGKKYFTATVSNNGNKITTSEANGLTTRKAGIKNIRAQARDITGGTKYKVFIQDNTGEKPCIRIVTETTIGLSSRKVINKPYVPGRKRK